VIVAAQLHYTSDSAVGKVLDSAGEVGRLLMGLANSLEKNSVNCQLPTVVSSRPTYPFEEPRPLLSKRNR
jgi:hypothetical protein